MLPEKSERTKEATGDEEEALRVEPFAERGSFSTEWRKRLAAAAAAAHPAEEDHAAAKGAEVLINYLSRRRQGHSRERGTRLKLATPQSFLRSLKRS